MDKQPNILFITADQLRPDFLGCAGASWASTPNIDKLAQQGTRFTRCYTNSPVCAPARIALATGLRPHRLGAVDNMAFLPGSADTYYKRLRDNEYYVGSCGKLDLAKPDKFNGLKGDRPCNYTFGFTHPIEVEGKIHCGSSPTPIGPYTQYLHDKGKLKTLHEDYQNRNIFDARSSALDTEDFQDVYTGRRAVEWLDDRPTDYPYHLFVSFAGPHDPFDPPEEYSKMFEDADIKPRVQDDGEGKPSRIHDRMKRSLKHDEETFIHMRRQYAASLKVVDDAIGKIIEAANSRDDDRDTYILFSADHGEMLGDHNLLIKHVAYEPSWGIPLIISGPGLPQGKVSNAMVELIDVGETVCDLAGLNRPDHIDAHSLLPLLKGKTEEHREYVLTEERPFRAIATEKWKFIETYNDKNELYNLVDDPDELNNVIADHADIARDLNRKMINGFMEGKWRRG